jgi:hypothetical protein
MSQGFTSRRKRTLRRDIPHLRDTRLLVIASEDTCAAKQYFESEIFASRRVQVKVLETSQEKGDGKIQGASAPSYVLGRLKEFVKDSGLGAEDVLCLMVDRDRWPEKMLSEVCGHALKIRKGKEKVITAISNPCFELWLYLHHREWSLGRAESKNIETELRRLLGSYNKSNLDIEQFKGKVPDAVRRAEEMNKAKEGQWPENPGTHVYRIVRKIWEITGGQP